ncbi:MAG: hypothetical protein M1834_001838 [Cirrosporium novae-zelandiae]|nr:MAG: hypothetical protein M1834_001838 [Cirrosporium novae-zelandiae]
MSFLFIALFSLLLTPINAHTLCTVPAALNSTSDSSLLISSTVSSCGSNSTILFPAGNSYTLYTPLVFSDLSNVEFVFEANISIPADVAIVQGRWITWEGENVTVRGSKNPNGGWFLAHGELWWATGNRTNRPHWLRFAVINVFMNNTLVDARTSAGFRSTTDFPFNTDAIDLSASDVLITYLTVFNGDDVINVSGPASNVTVSNINSIGSHGVAVSGTSGNVSNILFENATMENSLMGARFKGKLGVTGWTSNVTWKNFVITNTSYPIHFTEEYVDQEKGAAGTDTSIAAYAKNFKYINIKGSTNLDLADGSCITDPCWSAATGEDSSKAIYLLCKDAAHCKNFHFEDIDFTTPNGTAASELCTGLEGVTGMGITCTNNTITVE